MTDTMGTQPEPDTAGETHTTASTTELSTEQSGGFPALAPEAVVMGAEIERDDIARSRSDGSVAARLSGERFARLLYGPRVERHVSPYSVISPANPQPRGARQA